MKAAPIAHPTGDVLLYLNGVTVSFDGFKALNDLSLVVEEGELRTIIGPNGAGKTTMMDVITGKTRPDASRARPVTTPRQSGAVTVVHRRVVNAIVLVIAAAASGMPASGTTATPPPVSPSSTGGASWSCIHIVLVVVLFSPPEGGPVSRP